MITRGVLLSENFVGVQNRQQIKMALRAKAQKGAMIVTYDVDCAFVSELRPNIGAGIAGLGRFSTKAYITDVTSELSDAGLKQNVILESDSVGDPLSVKKTEGMDGGADVEKTEESAADEVKEKKKKDKDAIMVGIVTDADKLQLRVAQNKSAAEKGVFEFGEYVPPSQ